MTLATVRRFPRHAHDDYGIGLMLSGGHRSWSGRGPVEALPGDLIAVNPGEMHDGAPIRGAIRVWRMTYLRPAIVAGLADDAGARPFEFARPCFRDEAAAGLVASLFTALAGRTGCALPIEELLVALAARLFSNHAARPRRGSSPPPPIAKILQKLDDEPSARVTLAELASIAGISRFQLLRAFSQEVGVTPHAYLVQRRVRLARELMRRGRAPAEAALEAGFSDQSHLTRAFGRCYGVTPARFRAATASA
jgi:AraC-like DNA-binding protein